MTPEVAGTIWKDTIKAAEENNHPGKSTASCLYEWTSCPAIATCIATSSSATARMFRQMPYSALRFSPSRGPVELDGRPGQNLANQLLAISHNANLSDGWMYPVDLDTLGRPIDAAWAASRDRNERLVEIKQDQGAVRDPSLVVAQ